MGTDRQIALSAELGPQSMLKYVDVIVLSATFTCRLSLCASERAVSRYDHLTRSCVSKQ